MSYCYHCTTKNPPTHFLQQTAGFNKIIKLIIQVYSLNAISHEAELDGQFAKYGEIRIEPRYNERSQGKNYYNFILSYFFVFILIKKCNDSFGWMVKWYLRWSRSRWICPCRV